MLEKELSDLHQEVAQRLLTAMIEISEKDRDLRSIKKDIDVATWLLIKSQVYLLEAEKRKLKRFKWLAAVSIGISILTTVTIWVN